MAQVVDIASWVFLLIGIFLCVAGGIGLLRFPDVYARGHAAGVIDTGGEGFILLGLAFQAGFSLITFKLFLIFLLLYMTSPTATHALMKGALTGSREPEGRALTDNSPHEEIPSAPQAAASSGKSQSPA